MKGRIQSLFHDFRSRKWIIQLEADSLPEEIEQMKGDELNIEIKRWRAVRSLSANAYFHVLVHKLAEAVGCSDARMKNDLIGKYGQPEMIDFEQIVYKTNCPEEKMLEKEEIHSRCVKQDGKTYFYKIYRGSHTYNTEEMSRLIDMTVYECKELGIETIPPDELKRMLEKWKPKEI